MAVSVRLLVQNRNLFEHTTVNAQLTVYPLQRHISGPMTAHDFDAHCEVAMNTKRLIRWLPRVIGILFAAFISLFALDVFNEGYAFGELLIALLMHLIPTLLIIAVLAIAWRNEWIGAILFGSLALFYLVSSGELLESMILTVPLLLIAGLFLLAWLQRDQEQKAQ